MKTEDIEKLRKAFEATTPGPWTVVLGSGMHLCTGIADSDGKLVADFLPEYALNEGWAVDEHRGNMNFVELVHGMMPQILATLERINAQ